MCVHSRRDRHPKVRARLSYCSAFCAALVSIALSSEPLLASTILVEAGSNLSETGSDDIGKVRSYCGGASAPESNGGVGDATAHYLSQLDFSRIRGINVDNTSIDFPPDRNEIAPSGAFIAGRRLQSILREAKQHRYTPHIIVAQQIPYYLLQRYGPAWTWSEDAWKLYDDYAYRFVRHVVLEYEGGSASSLFEVGNETDIAAPEFIWTQQQAGPIGSQSRYDHLVKLYGIWQNAVARVANEAPSKQVSIAGPTITQNGMFVAPFDWSQAFINDVARNGWRLDAFSFHFFGDQGAVGNGSAHPQFTSLKNQVQSIRNYLKTKGLNARVAITEWASSSLTESERMGRINFTHEGAAWAVAFFKDAVSQSLHYASHLNLRDNFGAGTTGSPTFGSLIYVRNGRQYPKPVFNACKMFAQLPGTRKQVVAPNDRPNLVAIASADSRTAGLLVANYQYLFDYPKQNFVDRSVPESVTIQFKDLPFSDPAILKQYLVDANTSNVAAYIDASQVPELERTQLQMVREAAITVANGSVSLPQTTLGQSAVSLWIVRPSRKAK
ncbi:hypothetical protein [Altericista sp. CCNU0014]|uniref:hypothetical protein n=1 Tax=Altericista sp. CCNU0014 TaxID=3082949 RepID=UPI00384AB107